MTKDWINNIIRNLPFSKLSGPQVFNIVFDIIAAVCFIELLKRDDVTPLLILISFFGMLIFNLGCIFVAKKYYK